MVAAWSAVKQKHYWLFSHYWTIREQSSALHVEKQSDTIYGYVHE
jgi:hypothetical protein